MELLKKSIDNKEKIKYLDDFTNNDIYKKWSFPLNNNLQQAATKKEVKKKFEEIKEEIKQEIKKKIIQKIEEEIQEMEANKVLELEAKKKVTNEIKEDDDKNEIKKVKDIKEVEKGLKPIDLLRELYTIEGENYEVNKIIQEFLSKKEVSMKFTKKITSEIMQNLNENKWNINVCKLLSILIEKPILYRKKIINDNKYEGEPYVV
jgi:hypothetical protein